MRVGLMVPPQLDPRQVVPTAVRAEAQGFDLLACGEHVFFHGPVSNAFVTLAAAAGATRRIRLMTALTVLPIYPAALAAKMIATLDGVSDGRVEIGIGVGGEHPPEFDACGVPVRERGRRTDEALTVLSALLAGGPVQFAGRWTTLEGQALDPLPVQRPGPPIWVGGRREASIRRAGRHGDGWLPYLVTPDQLRDGLAAARQVAEEAGRSPTAVAGGVFCWSAVDHDGDWARRTVVDVVNGLYRQDLSSRADRYLVAGAPDEVASRLGEYADAGAQTVVFAPACPSEDLDRVVDTFASHVLPRLRPTPKAGRG
jgi:probable F420-dependent oxidoreductase